jgi:hypothetical protein
MNERLYNKKQYNLGREKIREEKKEGSEREREI